MIARGKIVDLRKLLAARFPHTPMAAATRRFITGLSFLDQVIGGGLPKGAITELISAQISAGSASSDDDGEIAHLGSNRDWSGISFLPLPKSSVRGRKQTNRARLMFGFS